MSIVSVTFDASNPSASLPVYATALELRTSLQQALQKLNSLLTNYNAGGVTETYIEALCILLGSDASSLPGVTIEGGYELLYDVAESAFAATAKGVFLDLHAADVGLVRKGPTNSVVPLIFSVTEPVTAPTGRIIDAGTFVSAEPSDPTKGPILFQTLNVTVIPFGAVVSPTTIGQAVAAGSAGDVEVGAIDTCVTDGSLMVTNPARGTGGTDQEDDDAPNGGLRKRVLAAIPNASQCTIAAIEEAALSYSGIESAVLLDNTDDDGVTFLRGRCQLYVDDGSGNLGDASDANYASLVALQKDLDKGLYRAAGVQVHVRGSVINPVTVALSVDLAQDTINFGYSQQTLAANVQAAVYAYVQGLPMGHSVIISQIIKTAQAVAGVSNVLVGSVLVNGVNADYAIPVFQNARIEPDISNCVVTVNAVTSYE